MFGLTIPIQFYIYAALSLAAIGGIGYGKYQSVKYDAYVSKAESQAKEQEMVNLYKAKEATQVNEKVKNDYQNKLALIKSTYGGMRPPVAVKQAQFPTPPAALMAPPPTLNLLKSAQ
jgi:hypothetical protein